MNDNIYSQQLNQLNQLQTINMFYSKDLQLFLYQIHK